MTSIPTPRLPYRPQFSGSTGSLAQVYDIVASGVLQCQLRSHGLSDERYSTISYVWNPETSIWYSRPAQRGKPISINDKIVSVRDKIADILCLMQ
jgi:hypothetical protein